MLINSSLLDIEGTLDSGNEAIKKSIEKWIKDNFKVEYLKISDNPNDDAKYEVSAKQVSVYNRNITSLTNGLFVWKEAKEYFYCAYCDNLTSFEGAPKEVGGVFNCAYCDNLTSLEGAPKEVAGNFDCSWCESLTSLKGAPKKVGGDFICFNCISLTSLKGAPKKVGGDFDCDVCKSLKSLKGAPKEVVGNFYCNGCTSLKSKDLPAKTKIKGKILNN